MAVVAGRSSRLLARSAWVLAGFVLLLIAGQALLLRPWAMPVGGEGTAAPVAEEVRLYQDALRASALLFEREIRWGREAVEGLAASVLDDIVAERGEAVQKAFAEFRRERPEARHVFLLNRFGRLLAVDPLRRAWRHEVYDYTRYFSWMTRTLSRRRMSSGFYHYLLEDVGEQGFDRRSASQPPFVTEKELDESLFGRRLAGLSGAEGRGGTEGTRPLAMFVASCVGRKTFWGYVGYTVPLSVLAERALAEAPQDLFALYVFSPNGHLLYGPTAGMEGMDGREDEVVRTVLGRIAAKDRRGVVEHAGRWVFYHEEGGLVFVGVPSRSVETRPAGIWQRIGLWRLVALFGLEVLLVSVVFGLYARRVVAPIGELVRRHVPEGLPVEGEDELSVLETMLDRSGGKGAIEDYLFHPRPEEGGEDRGRVGVADSEVDLHGLRDGPASAVYVAFRNLAELAASDADFAERCYRDVRRLAVRHGGWVQSPSSDTMLVYFGVGGEDAEHAVKAGAFLTRLLALVRRLNMGRDEGGRLRVGCAAETGEFLRGRFVVGGREEPFVVSPLVRLLRAYEGLAGDNAAIVGDGMFQAARTIEDRFLRKRLRLKVRDMGEEPLEVYLYRV